MLEEMVKSKWSYMSVADQGNVVAFVKQQLHGTPGHPSFVTTKMAVVYVCIGKIDYPTRFPDFFSTMQSFLAEKSTWKIGLLVLKICAEEFVRNDETMVLSNRKAVLKDLLLEQLPHIMVTLQRILYELLQLVQQTTTVDPVAFEVIII